MCDCGSSDLYLCIVSGRTLTYFVSDVHLGLDVLDKEDREARFVSFLQSIPVERTESLYLLGDIWDFWYEYQDVVPKGYIRIFSELTGLISSGVKVYFFRGNHDAWTYSYFASLGITVLEQPYYVRIGTKRFCLGHGDGLGPGMKSYKLMRWIFRARFFQRLFSLLHPWIAFRIATCWSKSSRLAKMKEYEFKGPEEPLYIFANSCQDADAFVFGHYHCSVETRLPSSADFFILRDWMHSSPYLLFDSSTSVFEYKKQ